MTETLEFSDTGPAWFDDLAESVPFIGRTGSFQAVSGRYAYLRTVVQNTSANAGVLLLWDDLSGTNTLVEQVTLAANAAGQSSLWWPGVRIERGIWVAASTMTVTGSVVVIPLDRYYRRLKDSYQRLRG